MRSYEIARPFAVVAFAVLSSTAAGQTFGVARVADVFLPTDTLVRRDAHTYVTASAEFIRVNSLRNHGWRASWYQRTPDYLVVFAGIPQTAQRAVLFATARHGPTSFWTSWRDIFTMPYEGQNGHLAANISYASVRTATWVQVQPVLKAAVEIVAGGGLPGARVSKAVLTQAGRVNKFLASNSDVARLIEQTLVDTTLGDASFDIADHFATGTDAAPGARTPSMTLFALGEPTQIAKINEPGFHNDGYVCYKQECYDSVGRGGVSAADLQCYAPLDDYHLCFKKGRGGSFDAYPQVDFILIKWRFASRLPFISPLTRELCSTLTDEKLSAAEDSLENAPLLPEEQREHKFALQVARYALDAQRIAQDSGTDARIRAYMNYHLDSIKNSPAISSTDVAKVVTTWEGCVGNEYGPLTRTQAMRDALAGFDLAYRDPTAEAVRTARPDVMHKYAGALQALLTELPKRNGGGPSGVGVDVQLTEGAWEEALVESAFAPLASLIAVGTQPHSPISADSLSQLTATLARDSLEYHDCGACLDFVRPVLHRAMANVPKSISIDLSGISDNGRLVLDAASSVPIRAVVSAIDGTAIAEAPVVWVTDRTGLMNAGTFTAETPHVRPDTGRIIARTVGGLQAAVPVVIRPVVDTIVLTVPKTMHTTVAPRSPADTSARTTGSWAIQAVPLDGGNVVDVPVEWQLSDPKAASLLPSGVVTFNAAAAGKTVTVTARIGRKRTCWSITPQGNAATVCPQ